MSIFTFINLIFTVFQFIFRAEIGDAYLGAVSRFMTNAFEYGDALLPEEQKSPPPSASEVSANTPSNNEHMPSNQPYLNRATLVITSAH